MINLLVSSGKISAIFEIPIVGVLIDIILYVVIIVAFFKTISKIPSEYKSKGLKGIINEILLLLLCIVLIASLLTGFLIDVIDLIEYIVVLVWDKIKESIKWIVDLIL